MKMYIDADGVWFDSQGPFDIETMHREIGQVMFAIIRGDIKEFECELTPKSEAPSGDNDYEA